MEPLGECDCGHDEIDHGHLSDHKPYVWECSKCDCKRMHPEGQADEPTVP